MASTRGIRVLGIEFDFHDFDEHGDTLYMHVGLPREVCRAIETSEGHIVEFDERGSVIGLELLNVKLALERDGVITVTWPPTELGPAALAPLLVDPA